MRNARCRKVHLAVLAALLGAATGVALQGADNPALVANARQSDTSIAVDSTGVHVVVGFTDDRGRGTSMSGFMYSDDGGATFADGGQLPTPLIDTVNGQSYPQILGHPDVTYVGGCTFVYLSEAREKFTATSTVQSLVLHRSTDCGHTWQGPFRILPSVNPNGLVDGDGAPLDSAEGGSTDIDPETGRYAVCWSNVSTSLGYEISCSSSDDVTDGVTFAPRRVISSFPTDRGGAVVRFGGGGSNNAYVAWVRSPGAYTGRIASSRSTDNGITWSAPVERTGSFIMMDEVPGNDRGNAHPSLAVHRPPGTSGDHVYVALAQNNSMDGSDIAFMRSTDSGTTFSPPVLVNSRPGQDRAQWFPSLAVDHTTGRVFLFYYDQGIDTSGDRTQVTYTTTADAGVTWTPPVPLSTEPFRAGWGNDTSQPNLGEHNGGVASLGTMYGSFAVTQPVGFTDGQPSATMTPPDVDVKVITGAPTPPLQVAGSPAILDSNGDGTVDPGEQVSLEVPLRNYVTNPLHAGTIAGISATLSTTAKHVKIVTATAPYPDVAAGATAANATPFRLKLAGGFVAGTPIPLLLNVMSGTGSIELPLTIRTGARAATTLLTEDFDTGAPGWTSIHGGGSSVIPWSTSGTFCGSSTSATHTETAAAGWERLAGPVITVPAASEYVSVDFDVCFDTEDDPVLAVRAYDGFFLSVADVTPGRSARTVLAEAFAQELTTGTLQHYPKHLPSVSVAGYVDDMSVWAGNSAGPRHVHVELPGMAGSQFRLVFEYTQDESGVCSDLRPGHTCGVSVDNVVVQNVVTPRAKGKK